MFRLEFWNYVKILFFASLVAIFVFFELKKVDDGHVEVFEVYDTEHESLNQNNELPQNKKNTREIIENMNTVSSVPVTSKPQKVLVLTFWRSGSTWVGKLLSKIPNTFYVYEPLHIIRYYWMERRINMYHGLKVNFLEQLLTCAIPLEFVYHLSTWPGMYENIKCNSSRCNIHRIITEECKNASFRIVKANRLQLQEVEEIFLKKTFTNLKVIYLVRDPRGVINSIRHIDKKYIDITVDDVCPRMRTDLAMYPILKELYPPNFFFLRYEDLANHSLKKAKELWCFIQDKEKCPEMSEEYVKYINESWKEPSKSTRLIGSFKTEQKSSQDWEIWRQDITEPFLLAAENNCGDVINDLGYRIFGSIKKAKNVSLSSLRHENCKNIPCVS